MASFLTCCIQTGLPLGYVEPTRCAGPTLSDVASFAEGGKEDTDEDVTWAHDNGEILAAKAERAKSQDRSNGVATTSQLEMQADKAGYGKLYAAFEGGISGLQACAAGRTPPCRNLSFRGQPEAGSVYLAQMLALDIH